VRSLAILVRALENVLPQSFEDAAVRRAWALAVLVGALVRVAEKDEALLLVTQNLLPLLVLFLGRASRRQ
jgi:hypothetical protein